MTLLLLDLASYQAGVDLSLPAYDNWGLANIKTSQGNWYVANRDRSRKWADQARNLGKGLMTFHWLDASASGAEQARIAYREMRELGGPDGMAHQADTEDDGKAHGPLTYRIWSDFVDEMQQLLGRHVLNYTGDWWWTAPGRNWRGADLTPYLMAAPNIGYLGQYPGDQSEHWKARYGGWDDLAAMQFHVGSIPNGGAGSTNVSQTAIRNPAVWAALTGRNDMSQDFAQLRRPIPNTVDWMTGDIADVDLHTVFRARRTAWQPGQPGDPKGDDAAGWWIVDLLERVDKNSAAAVKQTSGQPTQDQVDAAMLKAMRDPGVQAGLGKAFLAALRAG